MKISTSISQHQGNRGPRSSSGVKGKKLALVGGLLGLSCLIISPSWAGNNKHVKGMAAPIHLTGLSIHIGPGGFHFGIGSPFYGPAYVRPHVYVVPVPRPYWKQSRRHGHHHHYVPPQRFNRRHGWKDNAPQGQFRGNQGRGNGGHRRGHR